MGKIKVIAGYTVVVAGRKYQENDIVDVENTADYENKDYCVVLEKSKEKNEISEVTKLKGKKKNEEEGK